ncbi:hypothetical protein FQA39_LY02878 [Lamprigera yunnana]|nr:hypothetical protein FQA39_LY02878 [Lamprigera yunnana]
MLLTIVTFGLITIAIYKYGTHNSDYWEKKKVPFIKPTFFFGILYDTIVKGELIATYLAKFYNKFTAPVFGFYAMRRPFLVLRDLETIKNFLIKDAEYFSDRYLFNDPSIDSVIAYGLFGAKGCMWKNLRPCFSSFFTTAKVKVMFSLLNNCRKDFNDYLENNVNHNIKAKELAQKFASNVLARCVFGISINTFKDENSGFNLPRKQFVGSSFLRIFSLLCYYYSPALVRTFRLKFCGQRLTDFLVKVFNASIKEREFTKIKNGDMIDLFIEFKNSKLVELGLTWDVVTAQACLFYAAGQESVAGTIAFTLYELCQNVSIQNRLRTDIHEIKKKHNGITYNALQEMEYLDMVVSETLRKYPSVPQIHRQCVKNYKIPNTDIIIEKGTNVTISSFGIHHNPIFFPDPDRYDPERFNRINRHKIQHGSYLPYGEGLRSCIAQIFSLTLVKMCIVQLVEKYEVIKNPNTVEKIEFTMFPIIVQAKQPLNVTLRRST